MHVSLASSRRALRKTETCRRCLLHASSSAPYVASAAASTMASAGCQAAGLAAGERQLDDASRTTKGGLMKNIMAEAGDAAKKNSVTALKTGAGSVATLTKSLTAAAKVIQQAAEEILLAEEWGEEYDKYGRPVATFGDVGNTLGDIGGDLGLDVHDLGLERLAAPLVSARSGPAPAMVDLHSVRSLLSVGARESREEPPAAESSSGSSSMVIH